MKLFLFFSALLSFCSCGYRLQEQPLTTITVPYIQGDESGLLTTELVRQLSASGNFECIASGGTLLLKVTIVSLGSDNIGYRYDRKESSGRLQHNLVPTENRRNVSASLTLFDGASEKILLGPLTVKADADYDYVGTHSVRGLTFLNEQGKRETTLTFSLGQLDSVEGAEDDVLVLLYRHLAKKIVAGLMNLSG